MLRLPLTPLIETFTDLIGDCFTVDEYDLAFVVFSFAKLHSH